MIAVRPIATAMGTPTRSRSTRPAKTRKVAIP
jgi:hypothetical protein